jgi:hypothetical protein
MRFALNYIKVIDLVGCGNSLAGTIDLLMPWDPGRVVPNLNFLLCTIIAGVGLGLRTIRGATFCLIQLGPKTGEVEERWGDPTVAGRDGQERGWG